MDTNRLKRFAIEARNILMQGVRNRLQALGFDLNTGKPSELPQKMEGGAVFMGDTVSTDFYCRWMSLYNNICARGIRQVAEEAAYTWFNRFMAIRIMQKQGFISPVLAYESQEVRVPVIVSEARQGRMPQMSDDVRSKLMELLDDDSKTNEQFALLIVAYCHENPIINKCFGNIADYTELLLPQNILAEGGFVSMLNDTAFIKDDDFRSAELIGWLYQFYISDRKDEAFAKKGKYDADEIAPATQIFTPNWIVKYMVENTVGRIYIDNNPYCEVKDNLKYLVDTPSGGETLKVDDLAQLTVADLACGSGHILNECFDLLYAIYVEEGYSRTQGISNILRRNLLGIDLDTRAKQLATFALLMKACQKDSSFLDGKVMPRVYDMPHPIAEAIAAEGDTRSAEEYLKETLPHYLLGGNTEIVRELTDAILLMNHADTLGSIMKFDISEQTRNAILVRTQEYEKQLANGDIVPSSIQLLMPYMRIILALTKKYAALCMNPPYMGAGRFDEVLSKYVKDNYSNGKADLYAVFMLMGMDRLAKNGKMAQINMQSWMFLASFEKLRKIIIDKYQVESMLHLGTRTFLELSGEVVQNTCFALTNQKPSRKGIYYNLCIGDCNEKQKHFISRKTEVYSIVQSAFLNIPGCTFAYWLNEKYFDIISTNECLGNISEPRAGLQTSDNQRFLRIWTEVNFSKIGLNLSRTEALQSDFKWFPHNKGGETRKWYGNREIIINFENNGEELKYWLEHNPKDPTTKSWSRNLRNYPLYFKEGLTWGGMGNTINVRYSPQGSTFDTSGPMLFSDGDLFYILGLTNSVVFDKFVSIFAQGLSKGSGHFAKVPYIYRKSDILDQIVTENIKVSRQDWDAHETSWDFQRNELLSVDDQTYMDNINNYIEDHYKETGERLCIDPAAPQLDSLAWRIEQYKQKWEHKFKQLHKNEEELNRQFIDIYGLQDELTPDVPLNEITILQQGEITIE